jgi:site-specific recombinase XerD
MREIKSEQWLIADLDNILSWIDAFILDRKARNYSTGTIYFYKHKLKKFWKYCQLKGITQTKQITPALLRNFLLWLEAEGHNEGGRFTFYRAVKTFLLWYQVENDLDDWRNPIEKIKFRIPKDPPLEPADANAIKAILKTCKSNFTGKRDKTIILMLMDTGLRASEMLALDVDNVNPITGMVQVLNGKGGKFRTVYLGRKTRIVLRRYLKQKDNHRALFININKERLGYSGLRLMLQRRSKKADVEYQSPHSFRRLFAITMLRDGVDIFSLQMLMGHADIQVLRRYLKIVGADLQSVHLKASPVTSLDI